MTVATMANVEAGSYVVFAKTTVVQVSGGNGQGPYTRCTLDAGGATDSAETESMGDRTTLQTHLVATSSGTSAITLRCLRAASNATVVARQTKIIALKVDAATAEAVSG